MEEDNTFIEDESIVLEDSEQSSIDDYQTNNIIPYIEGRFKRSEDYRNQDEQRWLAAYRNYRGIYGPDVQFTEAEKSRVFIKVTKTKTLAAYQQLESIMFANNKFPLTVDPTDSPGPNRIFSYAFLIKSGPANIATPLLLDSLVIAFHSKYLTALSRSKAACFSLGTQPTVTASQLSLSTLARES